MFKRVFAVGIGLLLVGVVVAALAGAALVNTAAAQGPRGGGGRWATEAGTTAPNPDGCQPLAPTRGWGGGQGQSVAPGQGAGLNREVAGPEVTRSVLRTVTGVVTMAEFELGEEPQLSVQTADGVTVKVELGPEWYIEEQGFAANVGDRLTVLGHYDSEGTALIVHTVTNETTGQSTFFRDATGRPAWAGRGRRWSSPTTVPTI